MTPHRGLSTRERLVLKDEKIRADLKREGWTSHRVGGCPKSQLLEESYMGSYKQNNDKQPPLPPLN